MPNFAYPNEIVLHRSEAEHIAYVLGRLQAFLTNGNARATLQMTRFLTPTKTAEQIAGSINELNHILRNRLFPTTLIAP